ncbi:MAG: acyltransferase, partial [Candidatus Sericytochromatia bacterium]
EPMRGGVMIRRVLTRWWGYGEFAVVAALGKVFGVGVVVRYLRSPNPNVTVRLLRTFGAHVGERTRVKRGIRLDNVYEDAQSAGDLRHLSIGANCYLGDDVYFDLANTIELEDDVVVSGHVAFVTHADCNRSPEVARAFPRRCAPITIRRGAWLAYRATVLAGVTVGENAVIAAHALVREDAAPGMIHAGTPARALRRLRPAEPSVAVLVLRLAARRQGGRDR